MNHRAMLPLLMAGLAFSFSACEREQRVFDPPQGAASAPKVRLGSLQPGQPMGTAGEKAPSLPATPYTFEGNAFAVSQGKRLYRWFNCSGCHAAGGGGDAGPPLSDDRWIYGGEPNNIFASIAEGRPNGMPSFGGHIPEDQLWQIVAYVRTLSGQLRKDVKPGRGDTLQASPPEASRQPGPPKGGKAMDGTEAR